MSFTLSELVYDKRYPDADTYRGIAYHASLSGSSLRTGLPPLDNLYEQIAISVIEFQVGLKGGKMLETKIYREDATWNGIPTYNWDIGFDFYFPSSSSIAPEIAPIIIELIILAIIAAILTIGVVLSLNEVKQIIWGPPGSIPILPWAIGIGITVVAIAYAYSKIKGGEWKLPQFKLPSFSKKDGSRVMREAGIRVV